MSETRKMFWSRRLSGRMGWGPLPSFRANCPELVHSPAEQIGAAATHSSQSQPQPQIWVKHINLVAVLAKIFSPMFCCVAEI